MLVIRGGQYRLSNRSIGDNEFGRVKMIDLRMILWFVMAGAFAFWALILIGRNQKYVKQWFICLGIWLAILIFQTLSKDIVLPSVTILHIDESMKRDLVGTDLLNWAPSLMVVILSISIYLFVKKMIDAKKSKKNV